MTKGLGIREYRACVRCRSRKTRCDLQSSGEPGKPPCAKCIREGADCALAGSRRGGNFSRLRGSKKRSALGDSQVQATHQDCIITCSPQSVGSNGHLAHDHLQNPSDALLILAHAAGQPEENPSDNRELKSPAGVSLEYGGHKKFQTRQNQRLSRESPFRGAESTKSDILDSYVFLKNKTLTLPVLLELLQLYKNRYHAFFPIVPTFIFKPECISPALEQESFLITTILAVVSKDILELKEAHQVIWEYLRQRILDIVLGSAGTRHVGCVEGLLLLGEWNLPNNGLAADDSDGEATWSILGVAVRLAYRLRLEDSSFKDGENEVDPSAERQRLAWIFTYLSDRQISIRMGQAFWCRGPALSTRFTAQDFPSLQSGDTNNEDLASWLQAQVELTTLFGNAHDILFASKARTVELITRGDYVKYIDDTARAMLAWKHAWRSINISGHLKSCLGLMEEYLRLYVNAFAFQAVLYRGSGSSTSQHGLNGEGLDFPNSTMASADARHIYEALDAAESLLKIFTEDFDPELHLRYLPARFYLYEIHSSVFLFKAHASGAISADRYIQTKSVMERFLSRLNTITTDENHLASRYARLLHGLWFQRAENSAAENSDPKPGASNSNDVVAPLNLDFGAAGQGQESVFDEMGLDAFNAIDSLDGFLAMPPVFPYDLSMFFQPQ